MSKDTACPDLFIQKPHNPSLDEKFHAHSQENIANTLFWNNIFHGLASCDIAFNAIVECGVGRGRSLITLASLRNYYENLCLTKDSIITIYGLDSFEGFPEPTFEDNSHRAPKKGEWSYSPSGIYKYSPEFIAEVLANANVNDSYIELVKGFFNETTPMLAMRDIQIGILHCDGDLYQSVKSPLDNLHQKVVPGGFIVFDDFLKNSDPRKDAFPGARQAYQEFILDNGKKYEHEHSPRGNVVLRKII